VSQSKDEIIDISSWYSDEVAYQEGTLTKSTWYAPPVDEFDFIIKNHRYLFKQGRDWAPWQFWSEIVASIIGEEIDVNVPAAYAAVNSDTMQEGVLIEWFYGYPGCPPVRYTSAEQWFTRINPDFDTKKGIAHNLGDAATICRSFAQQGFFVDQEWRVELFKHLVLDALVGNVDRHQNNWGFLWSKEEDRNVVRFAPAFDNGTSLGYEILDRKLGNFNDETHIQSYVAKGTHHMRFLRGSENKPKHIELLSHYLERYKGLEALESVIEKVIGLDLESLAYDLHVLTEYQMPTPLSEERVSFMLRLLKVRKERISALLD